ncbi:MAG: hypothetical protein HY721_00070 [Planctomycetes bacterium]|nr:hypothetical protein [Planctomycetota bacterium]
MKRTHASSLLLCLAAMLCLPSCSAFRRLANRGHDLVENPGRSAAVRLPAGLGALVGHAIAIPFTGLLLPSYAFAGATVESSDGHGPQRDRGDIRLPLVLAPQEYGSGAGALVLGAPFDWVASLFRAESPGPPEGVVAEAPELPPGETDPRLDFEVRPPRRPPAPGPVEPAK